MKFFGKKEVKEEATPLANLVETPIKYTHPPFLQSVIVALIGGTITVLLSILLKDIFPYLYALINQRGPMQYLSIYCFWFGMGLVFFKWRLVKKQISAFKLPFVQEFTKGRETIGTKTIVLERLKIMTNLNPEESNYLIVNRINKAIKQLMVSKNPSQVSQVLATVSATDSAIVDTSYVPIKFLIWLIPIIGFLGTVMGMSKAISNFNNLFQGIKVTGFQGLQEGLTQVTAGLGVAFDTTFLALIFAVVINVFCNALQKKEEDFLSEVDDFVTENIVNKLVVKDEVEERKMLDSYKMAEALEDIAREVKNLSRQNQVSAEELQAQMGRLLEVFQSLSPSQITTAMQEFSKALQKSQNSFKAIAQLSELLRNNQEIMEGLKVSVEEMTMINRKLGELYSKIYKTSFL